MALPFLFQNCRIEILYGWAESEKNLAGRMIKGNLRETILSKIFSVSGSAKDSIMNV
jgi:hypothetical protein